MSRAIKFRVWSKNWGSMIYTDPLVGHSWGVTTDIFGMKENHAFAGANARANKGFFEEFAHYDPSYFLLEQFVGLQDKSGKDIYEGDIVRVQGWAMLCVVTYHFGGFACSYSWIVKDKDKEERVETANISMAYFSGAYLGHIEVVGNIHENPEMMK